MSVNINYAGETDLLSDFAGIGEAVSVNEQVTESVNEGIEQERREVLLTHNFLGHQLRDASHPNEKVGTCLWGEEGVVVEIAMRRAWGTLVMGA